jgi:HlyD family secretion protein
MPIYRKLLSSVVALTLVTAPFAVAETAAPAPSASSVPAITVSAVALFDLRDQVRVSGLVGPLEEVQVQPLIEGQPIETLSADIGDKVVAGQVLATLSSTTLQLQKSQFTASLASARATIAQAEAQLIEAQSSADEAQRVNDRTIKLKAQGTSSQAAADQANAAAISATARVTVAVQSLEAARAQLSLAEAQLANVDLQLSRTKVVAPVAGEVVERNALVGGIASAAGPAMFKLIRDGALELRADVAEVDLVRLAPGQTATMSAVGTSEPLAGTVRLVEPTIDATSRLGRVRITLDKPDLVRSGMFVDAVVLVVQRKTVAVPVTAVGSSADGATVMRVRDGLVERVPVVTGIRDGGMVEITSGVIPGDLIVTKAAAFVRDGDHINPVLSQVETN